jgi:hypothetical protein
MWNSKKKLNEIIQNKIRILNGLLKIIVRDYK